MKTGVKLHVENSYQNKTKIKRNLLNKEQDNCEKIKIVVMWCGI